jgi:UDP-N-acetylglucosamine/UDP-N-acetylgalactosamine 4-epimerase
MSKVAEYIKNNAEVSDCFQNPHVWVVSGVAGFIGSHIADMLLQLGQKVRGIDNFSTGKKSNIKLLESHPFASNFSFTESDVNDACQLRTVFQDSAYLIHQAALGSVPRSIEQPGTTHHSNVTGFLSVLDLARESSVKRVVYASSSSVYGDSELLPKVEEHIGKVLSPYAASKLCNEIYADAYARSYGISLVGLRYFNVFGPRQDPEGPYAAVIPRWLNNISNNSVCEIYGDGETSRDFCYIDNVVLANILAAVSTKLSVDHAVYNVACGERTTLSQLYEDISLQAAALLGKKVPKAQYREFRSGDVRHSHADISKISNELGYLPLVYRKEGIEYTVKSFLSV